MATNTEPAASAEATTTLSVDSAATVMVKSTTSEQMQLHPSRLQLALHDDA